MSNIRVTHDTDPNNARSESYVAINPHNTLQIVSISKKFRDIHNYDFTLATQFSTDGGLTWQESADLALAADFTILSDPALAWDDAGTLFLAGLSGKNPPNPALVGIEIYISNDGGQTWNGPKRIHGSSGDDKEWIVADANPDSPFHGRVYAVWDDGFGPTKMRFARTRDHGATWVGTGSGATAPGTELVSSGSFSPEINVAANGDRFMIWASGTEIKLLVSTDGGDSFQFRTSPATGIALLGAVNVPNLPNESFRVGTIPTACVSGQKIFVAWADMREGPSRIYQARSED